MSLLSNDDFEKRLLYSQKCISEDGPYVTSSVYGVKWTYPGASQKTTGRLRITCVYNNNTGFSAVGGTIERWTDKGWLLIDEYCDDNQYLLSEIEFREKLLKMAHSFVMGVPIDVIVGVKNKSLAIKTKLATKKAVTSRVQNKKIKEKEETSPKSDSDGDDIEWL